VCHACRASFTRRAELSWPTAASSLMGQKERAFKQIEMTRRVSNDAGKCEKSRSLILLPPQREIDCAKIREWPLSPHRVLPQSRPRALSHTLAHSSLMFFPSLTVSLPSSLWPAHIATEEEGRKSPFPASLLLFASLERRARAVMWRERMCHQSHTPHMHVRVLVLTYAFFLYICKHAMFV